MCGYVYFLTNPAMPGLLKVGFTTTSLPQRIGELDTTGVPDGFILAAAFWVTDPQACERAIHERLAEFRTRPKREFFRIPPSQALGTVADLLCTHLHDPSQSPSTAPSPSLDLLDEHILQFMLHDTSGECWPQIVAWELHIHREEAHLRLGELVAKGYLRDQHGIYSLTHKGRKYVFDRRLVIEEALPETP
jgi:hypothetical protein